MYFFYHCTGWSIEVNNGNVSKTEYLEKIFWIEVFVSKKESKFYYLLFICKTFQGKLEGQLILFIGNSTVLLFILIIGKK